MENYNQVETALSTATQLAQLADGLTLAADMLHRRLLSLIRNDRSIQTSDVQALFDTEVALRQQANHLYTDAAGYTITGLDVAQESVMAAVLAAQHSIARVERVKELIDAGVNLLALMTALLEHKPEAIFSALKKIGG